MGMAADYDIAYAEPFDGKFNSRFFTAARRAIGWYDIAGVSHDEQLTRLGLSHEIWVNPRIRAGDQQRVRVLPLGQLCKERLLSGKDFV